MADFISMPGRGIKQVVNPRNLPAIRPIAGPPSIIDVATEAAPEVSKGAGILGKVKNFAGSLKRGLGIAAIADGFYQAANATAKADAESGLHSSPAQVNIENSVDANGLPNLSGPEGYANSTLGISAVNPITGAPKQTYTPNPKPQSIAAPIQPLPNEAALRQEFINNEQAQPAAEAVKEDPNGFAIVDGINQKINYADIGIAGKDPLKSVPAIGTGNASFIPMNDQKAEHEQFMKDNAIVEVPLFGADGRITGWKNEKATAANSFNGQSIAAIAGDPNGPYYADNINKLQQNQVLQAKSIADTAIAQQNAATDALYKKAHAGYFDAERKRTEASLTPEGIAATGSSKTAEEERKLMIQNLNNGFGVAATPQAIDRYQNHVKQVNQWETKATNAMKAIQKTQPELAAVYLPLVKQYHEATDPKAREEVKKSIDKVLGPQRLNMPVFTKLLTQPAFDKNGLVAWKKPDLPGA